MLAVDDVGARVFFADHGQESIGLDAVEWAAPFINDDTIGAKPSTVAEVLKPGDVGFRRTAEAYWRLAQIPEAQGAFVALDPFDGAIVALNGGLDFGLNNFNRATQARRQPGSASSRSCTRRRSRTAIRRRPSCSTRRPTSVGQAELERVWRPENFNGKYYGPSRLREALLESMNAVSIRITQSTGVPAAVSHVKRFGFDDEAVPRDLSLALGAGGVAPVTLAGAYATFANGGYKVTPYFIDRVVTADGEVLYETKPLHCPDCNTPPETPVQLAPKDPELVADATELYPQQQAAPRIISPQNAYLIGDMLWDVVTGGARAPRRALNCNATTLPARRARRTTAATSGSSASTPTSSARRGWGSINSAARRVRARRSRGASDVGRLHARSAREHGRAATEEAARHRRVPHQPRDRAHCGRRHAEHHFREVRYRPLAGA